MEERQVGERERERLEKQIPHTWGRSRRVRCASEPKRPTGAGEGGKSLERENSPG